MSMYQPGNEATVPSGADPKWRYFWKLRCDESPEAELEQVVPHGFPCFEKTMDSWGSSMLKTVETVAELLAVGYGLNRDTFTGLMRNGEHLLAPTGTDLSDCTTVEKVGTVFAGYHYDMNFLTCHGPSRFPALFIWLRTGERTSVSVPMGCLLLQAGRQLAWLTGGDILEGMHEVVCSQQTVAAVQKAQDENRSLWRVSSTVFAHVDPEVILKPIAGNTTESPEYPPTKTKKYVEAELSCIKLSANT